MNTYRVKLSDRQRARNIEAPDAKAAVEAAVGQRLIHANLDTWKQDGTMGIYAIAVATGPTRGGSTPFRNITAHVTTKPAP